MHCLAGSEEVDYYATLVPWETGYVGYWNNGAQLKWLGTRAMHYVGCMLFCCTTIGVM